MTTYPIRTRRWTRKEYQKLAELGILAEDEPIELLDGQLIVAEPQGAPHATMVRLAARVLTRRFGDGWLVYAQGPIALDEVSEPEPDVVVAPGGELDYFDEHPAHPALLVEVAHTSLAYDRVHKGSAYARAGVPDYWIVNLVDWRIEVYRRPVADDSADLGWRYASVETFVPGTTIVPLARPDVSVAVAEILPEALRRLR